VTREVYRLSQCKWPVALKTTLVFILFGPPIGLFVFGACIIGSDFLSPDGMLAKPFGKLVSTFILGVVLSYAVGFVPALYAGAFAGFARSSLEPTIPFFPVVIGLPLGLVFALLFERVLLLPPLFSSWQFDAIKVLTCLVPTTVCWYMTSRFQMGRT
jgi:hypothetical protein